MDKKELKKYLKDKWKKLYKSKIDEHINDIRSDYKKAHNMRNDELLTPYQEWEMWFMWVNL